MPSRGLRSGRAANRAQHCDTRLYQREIDVEIVNDCSVFEVASISIFTTSFVPAVTCNLLGLSRFSPQHISPPSTSLSILANDPLAACASTARVPAIGATT